MFSLAERCRAIWPEPRSKSFTAWAKPTKRASGSASTASANGMCPAGTRREATRMLRRPIAVMTASCAFERDDRAGAGPSQTKLCDSGAERQPTRQPDDQQHHENEPQRTAETGAAVVAVTIV